MQIDFEKFGGLIPAIVQDYRSARVLMLGFMNEEAFRRTCEDKRVTFFSRTKDRIWTKGETSGNFLFVRDIQPDCDNDTILIQAEASGPVCHTGSATCFGTGSSAGFNFFSDLEQRITQRKAQSNEDSYTARLFRAGLASISQKVGEEATEVVVASLAQDDERLVSESADLLFHLMVLLRARGLALEHVVDELRARFDQMPADKPASLEQKRKNG